MKMIKYFLGVLLIFSAISSCQDELSVDLSERKFVRITKQSVYLNVGEKMTLSATTDTLGSINKTFNWSVIDSQIATIETGSNNSAIITGLQEGITVIMVESSDGELKYFTDLSVSGDKVVKILSIGDRVSEDATENYLYNFAKADGSKVIIGNLFLQTSSLQNHWSNASNNADVYQLRIINSDGSRSTFNNLDIINAITEENWDFVVFQETSNLAGVVDGYQEFLPKLVELTKSYASNPDMKIALHQPWAYSSNASQEGFSLYEYDQIKMYNAIVSAVNQAASESDIDIIIPSGTAIQNGRTTYMGDQNYLGDLFTRDGLLLSLQKGRFTVATTWYESLFGENVTNNTFSLTSMSEYESNLIKESAHAAVIESSSITPIDEYRYPEGFELNTFELTSPIYIDFGTFHSPAPFNNYNHPGDPKIADLKDGDGASTYFEISVNEPFSGTLERNLANNLGFPHTASRDMFFSDGNLGFPISSFALSNFNKDQKYTFVFYGHINDGGTQTEYKVIGKNNGVDYLATGHNLDNVAIVADIYPTDYGTLIVRLTKGPENVHWAGFFGINAMVIFPEGYPIPYL